MPSESTEVSLWRHRDFVLFWSGQTVDQFGSKISWLAVPLIAIVTLHATKFDVAALAAAGSLPQLVVSLPAGAVVDRVRRRPLMIGCALGCAVAMGSIPFAAAVGHVTLAQLYAVAFTVGTLSVFFTAAAATLPLLLVGREDLVDANGKTNSARGLAEMTGPSVGGFLVGLMGAARAVGIDAFSYVFAAVTLLAMRLREPKPEPRRPEARLTSEMAAGIRLTMRHPLLRTIVLANSLVSFLLAGVSAIWLLYVLTDLHWSVRTAGLVYGLTLIGGVVGGLYSKRVTDRLGMNTAMILGCFLSAPLEIATPLAPHGPAGVWLIAAAFTVLTAVGMVNSTAMASVRQLVCPPDMLGRMGATTQFFSGGLMFLGPLAAGAAATWIGLRPTLFVFTGLTLFWGLILLLSPIRTMRDVPVHAAYATV